MGVVVGILSLLVTFLLGWNIFQALKIDDKLDNYDKTQKKQNSVNRSRMDAYAYYTMSRAEIKSQEYINSYVHLLDAIVGFWKAGEQNLAKLTLGNLMYLLRVIRKKEGVKNYVRDADLDGYKQRIEENWRYIKQEELVDENSILNGAFTEYISRIAKTVNIIDCYFTLFKPLVVPIRRNYAIYALIVEREDECRIVHNGIFTQYEEFLAFIQNDLEVEYDFVGVSIYNNQEELNKRYNSLISNAM